VLLELITGSFYLLMLALGAVVGALCAYLGVPLVLQFVCAALSASACVFVCYLVRRRRRLSLETQGNRNINLDIGETVNIHGWNDDGTAQVRYRGAQWTVMARAGQEQSAGIHKVVSVVGSRLVVEKAVQENAEPTNR